MVDSVASQDRELVDRRGFAAFARMAWPLVEVTPCVWSWHMTELCNHYEAWARGEFLNLACNVPPGHSKSTIVSKLLVPWIWTWWPGYRGIQVTYEMTTRYTGASLAVMRSSWYQKRWGNLLGRSTAEGMFYTKAGGSLMATTPLARGTGYHAHGIIVDDPIKADLARGNAKTLSAALDRVSAWWTETMSSRAADKERGVSRSVIMQRLHELDLTGAFLRQGDVVHLSLPARFEVAERCVTVVGGDRRTREGEFLDTKRQSEKSYNRDAKFLGGWASAAAQAQMQQKPSPPGGASFKATHMRRFTLEQMPIEHTRAILSLDCSFKDGTKNDFVAAEIWGSAGGNYFCYDSQMERHGFNGTLTMVLNMLKKWPTVREVLIEDAANGPAVIETLTNFLPQYLIIPEPAWGGVAAKAETASGYYERARVCHLHGTDWVERKETQLVRYPNGVQHDDDIAAGSQAINFLARESNGIEDAMAGFRAMGLVPGVEAGPLEVPETGKIGFQRDPAFSG